MTFNGTVSLLRIEQKNKWKSSGKFNQGKGLYNETISKGLYSTLELKAGRSFFRT